MKDLREADGQEPAYLAGGPVRCIDTAIVRLVEAGSVRASRDGRLTIVSGAITQASSNDVEAAVLREIANGKVTYLLLRTELASSAAIQQLQATLVSRSLLRASHSSWPRRYSPRAGASAAGLSVLREHRRALRTTATGSGALAVALGGPGALPDVELRHAIFGTRAARSWGRSGHGNRRTEGYATFGGVFWGGGTGDGWDGGGGDGGAGGGGCGGAGCGGG